MTAFTYQALTTEGKIIYGVLEADSKAQARQVLREKNLLPTELLEIQGKNTRRHLSRRPPRLTNNGLLLLTEQLATLLHAGLPLTDALQACAEQSQQQRAKQIIHALHSRVTEGHSLAQSMNEFSNSFSTLYRATIASGEQSGHLDQVLQQLATYLETQKKLKQKVQQALLYPGLMTLVAIAVVSLLLLFVVPKMVTVFAQAEQQLPLITRCLLFISDTAQHLGLFILGGLTLLIVGIRRSLQKSYKLRYNLHHLLLQIPILKNVLKTINSARYNRTLGILSNAGVPILEAMSAATQVVSLLPMADSLQQATLMVREGTPLHHALRQSRYFSPLTLHLIASGEKSGTLEAMLQRAADNQEQEIKNLSDTVLTLFEPLLILIMGGIVLFIVLGILLPLFSLNQFIL